MHKLFLIMIACLIGQPTLVLAAELFLGGNGKLNQSALMKAYNDADWEQVTKTLESYLRKNGDYKVEVEERLFAYKYLGVIYAADSTTQAKAESYFTRLLNLASDVEIVDLYASRRVNDLFREVKREHLERKAYEERLQGKTQPMARTSGAIPASEQGIGDSLNQFPKSSRPLRAPSSNQVEAAKKRHAWIWWTVGAAAVAGTGVGLYYLSQPDKEKVTEVTRVTPGNP